MITYEYPLVERIRTLLRLEDLFERARFFFERSEPPDHHAALITLFEILEVAGRADLKSDLLQELDRQKQVMHSFRSSAEINQEVLAEVVREIEDAHEFLHSDTRKIGQHLRDNEWLMAIKQRTAIPGGACEFDLPAYHYWLHRDATARLADLRAWIAPLLPLRDAASLVLKLLREAGSRPVSSRPRARFSKCLAVVRRRWCVSVSHSKPPASPEISANRYART